MSSLQGFLNRVCPPFIRDNEKIMRFIAGRLLPKEKVDMLIHFKRDALKWTPAQLSAFYAGLPRNPTYSTDITDGCVQYIIEYLGGFSKPCSILDIACGSGYLATLLAQKGYHVVGMDYVVEETRPEDNPYLLCGDINEMPFETSQFDIVISAHTLEHIVDIQKAISELRRVAKHALFIIVPCQQEYQYMFDSHIHFFPYIESFLRVMGNPQAKCFKLDGDIIYIEEF